MIPNRQTTLSPLPFSPLQVLQTYEAVGLVSSSQRRMMAAAAAAQDGGASAEGPSSSSCPMAPIGRKAAAEGGGARDTVSCPMSTVGGRRASAALAVEGTVAAADAEAGTAGSRPGSQAVVTDLWHGAHGGGGSHVFGLDSRVFYQLFPFHILVNKESQVLQVRGPCAVVLCPCLAPKPWSRKPCILGF